jgi:hypothetical protein
VRIDEVHHEQTFEVKNKWSPRPDPEVTMMRALRADIWVPLTSRDQPLAPECGAQIVAITECQEQGNGA